MNVSELLTATRNLGAIPATGALGARDVDLLTHADQALISYLLPRLLNLREDYYTLRTRTAISSSNRIRLPSRAAFNKLRDVYMVQDSRRLRLIPIPSEDLAELQPTGNNIPDGYLIEGNAIVLLPDSGSYSGDIEFVFFQRPGALVLSTAARQVLSVSLATKQVTLASAPPPSWTASLLFDAHSPDSGAELKLWDAAVTSIVGSVITFTNAIDGTIFGTSAIAANDWIVLAGKSALPVLPSELHALLARAAALQLAESTGDTAQAKIHASLLDRYLAETTKLMEQRIEGQPVRLSAAGPLRRLTSRFLNRR